MSAINIAEVSRTPRAGVKGPGAAAWLAALGLPVPDAPNTWLSIEGGLIARLGLAEFLVEGAESAKLAAPPAHGVYPVLRQDTALVLTGERLDELLAEVCSVDFQALDPAAHPVVLTTMAGVTVVAIPTEESGMSALRLWCDSTWGAWFSDTLAEVAGELIQPIPTNHQGATS
ncbi:MAG: methylglutamate dehydrogenase [Pseudomonadota bacterium]